MVNLLWPKGNPKPTLSGLGVISSSIWRALPEPNCTCKVVSFIYLEINLLLVDSVLKIYGASPFW